MIASGGPIILGSPPTPIQAIINLANITSSRPQLCHGIMFEVLPTNVGRVYIGAPTMDRTTFTDLFAILAIPTDNFLPTFSTALTIAPNALCVNDFWVDADEGGDGVIVTFLVL